MNTIEDWVGAIFVVAVVVLLGLVLAGLAWLT